MTVIRGMSGGAKVGVVTPHLNGDKINFREILPYDSVILAYDKNNLASIYFWNFGHIVWETVTPPLLLLAEFIDVGECLGISPI